MNGIADYTVRESTKPLWLDVDLSPRWTQLDELEVKPQSQEVDARRPIDLYFRESELRSGSFPLREQLASVFPSLSVDAHLVIKLKDASHTIESAELVLQQRGAKLRIPLTRP